MMRLAQQYFERRCLDGPIVKYLYGYLVDSQKLRCRKVDLYTLLL